MRKIYLSTLVLVLCGCATTYQPKGFSGGFSETQLDTNVFRVAFNGNGYTGREKAEDYALLRSAELALQNGFTHFAILDSRAGTNYSTFRTPTQSTTTGTASVYGNTAYGSATTTTTGGQSFLVQKPSSTNTIFCFKGKPEGVFTYDAAFLQRSLSQKYKIDTSK